MGNGSLARSLNIVALSDMAATRVLAPDVRDQVLERTRGIIRTNLPKVTNWLDERGDLFSYHPPDAGAICYVRYHLDINSSELAEQLRAERGVLIVPGDHFGMDRFIRFGFGNPAAELEAAFDRIADHLNELRSAAPVG